MTTSSSVIVLIPAYMEGARIAETVRAARALRGVNRVLVIDDGSTDNTATQAKQAGAEVLRLKQNGGKGAALRAGLAKCPGGADDIILLLDADLGTTAAEAAQLLTPVLHDEADMTIARFPKATGKAGFGLVKGLARVGTWLLTRNWLQAPISGQRACRRWVLDAAPLANGYGIEVAMNVAAGDAGARIVEVPVQMAHNATGRNLKGFKHRGRQYAHIFSALTTASLGRTGERVMGFPHPLRFGMWLAAIILALGWVRKFVSVQFWEWPWQPVVTFLLVVALLGPCCAALFSGLLRARKKNYAGRYIPALGGLLVLPVCIHFLVMYHRRFADLFSPIAPERETIAIALLPLFLLAWMALGLVDDVKGDATRKGFRGHLRALAHGKLSTGGVKLLGGGVLALLMAWFVRDEWLAWYIAVPAGALLIALFANAMNLFDLRPGRALKVFWLMLLPLVIWLPLFAANPSLEMTARDPIFLQAIARDLWLPALALLLATLVYAPFDFSGMMMLGDTGANPLGGFLGFCLVVVLPLPYQVLAVGLLIGLHIYAEKYSITRTIERIPALRWLDQLGRGD